MSSFRDDPLGNSWLLDPATLLPGQYIDALRLRTNTFGVRRAIGRADGDVPEVCRRCHNAPESLGHVLGQCIHGRHPRIERHNAVVGLLEEECLKQGLTVAKEQTFYVGDEPLRPDLVVKAADSVYVVDVTVRYENVDSLSQAALEKVRKYTPLLPTLRQHFGATKGEVIPVVLGSRGALPKGTRSGLAKFGVVRDCDLRRMSLIALRSSLDIARQHLDYDRGWDPGPRPPSAGGGPAPAPAPAPNPA